jgi:hypothetical protein
VVEKLNHLETLRHALQLKLTKIERRKHQAATAKLYRQCGLAIVLGKVSKDEN